MSRKVATDREAWLKAASAKLRPYIRSKTGLYVPDVNVSTGFPSSNATRTSVVTSIAIGQCWNGSRSADKRCHIFVSPFLGDAIRVLDVLAHELLHAALGTAKGHGPEFAKAAESIGLTGKPTATVAGEAFRTVAIDLIKRWLGAYPHPRLSELDPSIFGPFDPSLPPGSPMPRMRPKQKTRMRLYECQHGQKVRAATDNLSATCNLCGTTFARKS